MINFLFILNSILFGIGLAMDAFSVSLANGLNDPLMKRGKMCGIAGMFAAFQALMPILGWVCVHTIVEYFSAFEKFVPWIALVLLAYIGGKMLVEGLRKKDAEDGDSPSQTCSRLTFGALVLQGIATSIDALSVGFDIASYDWLPALVESLIIAAVTFALCIVGVLVGKKFGTRLSRSAAVLGGVILICIGLEIFISSFYK